MNIFKLFHRLLMSQLGPKEFQHFVFPFLTILMFPECILHYDKYQISGFTIVFNIIIKLSSIASRFLLSNSKQLARSGQVKCLLNPIHVEPIESLNKLEEKEGKKE